MNTCVFYLLRLLILLYVSIGTINILVHTDQDVNVPTTWGDSDPKLIEGGGEHVRLKSFSTSVHKISALVAYRIDDEE